MAIALVISDTHDNIQAFRRLLKVTDFDLLILAGDICEFRCNVFYHELIKIPVPIIIVPGNHDCVPCFEAMSKKLRNLIILKKDVILIDINGKEIYIGGLGGVLSRKRSDMHRFSYDDLVRFANKLLQMERRLDILITHECAKKCSDVIPFTGGARGGKRALYLIHILGQPRIHVCGHMHVPKIERKGETICMNPGFGFSGMGGLIHLDKWTCELFRISFKYDFEYEWRIIYGYNWVRNVKRSYYRILENEALEMMRE